MLVPKRVKHRKVQRGSMKGKAKGGTRLNHGEYGIQALEAAWITNRQIEAARIAMTRYMKRGGKVWITIFPDKPITKKPAETRMGSVRATPRHGSRSSSPAASCSRSVASTRPSPRKRSASPSTSCPSSARLFLVKRKGRNK